MTKEIGSPKLESRSKSESQPRKSPPEVLFAAAGGGAPPVIFAGHEIKWKPSDMVILVEDISACRCSAAFEMAGIVTFGQFPRVCGPHIDKGIGHLSTSLRHCNIGDEHAIDQSDGVSKGKAVFREEAGIVRQELVAIRFVWVIPQDKPKVARDAVATMVIPPEIVILNAGEAAWAVIDFAFCSGILDSIGCKVGQI